MNDKEYPIRSDAQNRAMHKWFTQIADTLNDAGYEQQINFGTMDVPWSMEAVKINFKMIAYKQFGKMHTSELTTKELKDVQETIIRELANKGIELPPFPSIDSEANNLIFNQ